MNKCQDCQVEVIRGSNTCPLCFKKVGEKNNNTSYPKYNTKQKDKTVFNIFLFLSIAVVIITATINITTFKYYAYPWSLFIFLIVVYLWVLIRTTIMSKMNGGAKVLLQASCLAIGNLIIDVNTGYYHWSINYVIPFIICGSTLFVLICVSIKKMLWNEYISYIIALLFLGFVPTLLYLFNIATVLWPSVISAIFSILTFISLMIFSNKKFKDDFESRFHI